MNELVRLSRRRRNLAALLFLPLAYLLLLPQASEQGLAAGLLAPAGLERTGHAIAAVLLLQLRVMTVWVFPGALLTWLALGGLDRLIARRGINR